MEKCQGCPKVSIIVLNWNGWEDTLECLESLYQITCPNYEVVIVDNGSTDDSVEKIKAWADGKIPVHSDFFEYNPNGKPIKYIEYDEEITRNKDRKKRDEIKDLSSDRKFILIKIEKNQGFAGGNNIGIKYALTNLNPDYVLLLSNDIVVDRDFLFELVKVANSDKKIGIVGPKIYYYNLNGRKDVIWSGGGKINWLTGKTSHLFKDELDKGQTDRISEVDYLTGCVLLIKEGVINKIGLLAEEYFTYFEDSDYCVRSTRNGYKNVFVPSSKIWHKVSKTTKFRSQSYIYHFARNRIIFIRKNGKTWHKILFYPYQLIFINLAAIVYFGIKYKKLSLIKKWLEGIIDGLVYNIK